MQSNLSTDFSCPIIGYIKSPFADKFAVPRQPGLAPSAISQICFYKPYSDPKAFIALEGFSHLHLIFFFDKIEKEETFRAMVRPPRLGGNQHVGVFASRSPFRPSRIGLSVVELVEIKKHDGEISLFVSGADLVDGTPILDIKPYIPFVDAKLYAKGGFATEKPPLKQVIFKEGVRLKLKSLNTRELKAIEEILAQDPRPAYKAGTEDVKLYRAQLYNFEIVFSFHGDTVLVEDVLQLKA